MKYLSLIMFVGVLMVPAIPEAQAGMKARITVTLKPGVLDPQGKMLEEALKALGVNRVTSVRPGKVFDIELDVEDERTADLVLKDAAEKLLVNPTTEDYRIER